MTIKLNAASTPIMEDVITFDLDTQEITTHQEIDWDAEFPNDHECNVTDQDLLDMFNELEAAGE